MSTVKLSNGGKKHSDMALKALPNGKQDISSIQVKMLSKSEQQSLRKDLKHAVSQMMAM